MACLGNVISGAREAGRSSTSGTRGSRGENNASAVETSRYEIKRKRRSATARDGVVAIRIVVVR